MREGKTSIMFTKADFFNMPLQPFFSYFDNACIRQKDGSRQYLDGSTFDGRKEPRLFTALLVDDCECYDNVENVSHLSQEATICECFIMGTDTIEIIKKALMMWIDKNHFNDSAFTLTPHANNLSEIIFHNVDDLMGKLFENYKGSSYERDYEYKYLSMRFNFALNEPTAYVEIVKSNHPSVIKYELTAK